MSYLQRASHILPRLQARISITLEITRQGGAQMLHDDALDLSEFGTIQVQRASHVEFCNVFGLWQVTSAKTGRLLSQFESRAAALAWEKNHYSPTGLGWSELAEA